MWASSEESWIRRLLDVGRALTKELDQSILLDRVLETAREITQARYAALGILNEQHTELAQQCASAMLKLLNDRELTGQLGHSGRAHVREHFLLPRLLMDELRLLATLDSGVP